jgi:hypothetical protein
MPLALPHTITDPPVGDSIQANFDAIKNEFPLGRRHMAIETPHVVGLAGEPAFQGTWVNYDTSVYRGLRFWKDPTGMVHIEGAVKSGTIGTTVFILPAGYRPGAAIPYPAHTNSGYGQVDVAASGNVVAQTGGITLFGIFVHFKQES